MRVPCSFQPAHLRQSSTSVRMSCRDNLFDSAFCRNTVMSFLIHLVLFATCSGMVVGQVYGEPTPLNGTEGNNITLPHKLMKSGTLTWNGTTWLTVVQGTITRRSHNRLLWNNSTGEITIIKLQRNDTGKLILNIRNSEPITYYLTVHATPPVSPPGNEMLWLLLPLVLVLVLVLAGLAYHFRLCQNAVEFFRRRRHGGSGVS